MGRAAALELARQKIPTPTKHRALHSRLLLRKRKADRRTGGAAHDSEVAADYDEARERFLRSMGLTVIRIENRYVTENLEGVLAHLSQNFRGS